MHAFSVLTRTIAVFAVALGSSLSFVLPAPSASAHTHRHVITKDHDDFEYAVILDDHQTTCSVSDTRFVERDRRLQKRIRPSGRLVSQRSTADTYVIHDARWVKRAREIIAPMSELGQKQGELGKVQGELGRRQGRLGARQGEIGMRQAAISMRLDALESRIDRRRERGDIRERSRA
jgi:hypothetical protein